MNLWKKIVKNKSGSSENLNNKPEPNEKSKPSEKTNQNNSASSARDQKGKSSGAGGNYL